MKAEEDLILLLSNAGPSGATLKSAEDILRSAPWGAVDYGRMMDLAVANGVAPLLYDNLKGSCLVPDDRLALLRKAFLHTVADNVRKGREVVRITALLKARGIESIVLKGPVAAEDIFGNPGLYPSGDIDILVRPADLDKAGKILTESGYTFEEGAREDMLAGTYHLTFHGHYAVEIHWTLSFRYFDIPPEFWWENARTIEYEGMEVKVLSAERYILYAVFRLYNKAFKPLKYFVLPAGIINKYHNEIDWSQLFLLSERYGMRRLVIFALRMLHDLLGSCVPAEVLRTRIHGYGLLGRLVLSGFFKKSVQTHSRMLIYTILQDSARDTLRILYSRVLPDKSEIRLRYRLTEGSRIIYAYYMLNPFLLLLRRYKR